MNKNNQLHDAHVKAYHQKQKDRAYKSLLKSIRNGKISSRIEGKSLEKVLRKIISRIETNRKAGKYEY
jgi:hypothetical protein